MTDNLEKQRMATLLHSPELYSDCKWFNDASWSLNGNKWIWDKFTKHLSMHKTVPTFNILLDYAECDKTSDSVAIVAAKELLKEYQAQSPLDHTYFRNTLAADAKKHQFKEMLMSAAEHLDVTRLKDDIEALSKQSTSLPTRLNLQSLMTKPSNDNQCLLNEWAFERQAILAIVAPTGIGKSVLTMQLSTHFACGKSVIGFNPHKAYKVLVIQNEDSDNDIALMRDGSMSLLSDNEKQMVYDNLFFVRLRGSSGDSFLSALETYCEQFKPDMVFVNPLLKYYGGDPLNTKDVSNFLNHLEPILEKYNCGLVLVHHTVKQSKTSRINQVDSSYSGFGSSAWSNSVRDTIEIRASKLEGYYKLLAGKRAGKWGWKERYIQRSVNPLLPYWTDASDMDIKQLVTADKSNVVSSENKDAIYEIIPMLPLTITIPEIIEQTSINDKSCRNHIKSLIAENRVAEQAKDGKGISCKRYYRTQAENN